MRGVALLLAVLATTRAAAEEAAEPSESSEIMGISVSAPKQERARDGVLVTPSVDEVDASDAVDEMLDELAADLAKLGAVHVSPILVQKPTLSENLNGAFANTLETRLSASVSRASKAAIVRCLECLATRGTMENATWVVRRGLTRREDLLAIAKSYGAKTILTPHLAYDEAAGRLTLDVELVRAEDATVAFAETYRFDANTAMLYRGADRAQKREERLRDLEARLDARPQYGHAMVVGAMFVPMQTKTESGRVRGMMGAYRLYEKFGPDRQYRAGFSFGGFMNIESLAGVLLNASMAWRVTDENVYRPTAFVGWSAGAFMTGTAGNTVTGSAFGEVLFGHRVALQLNMTYMQPFELAKIGKVGGWAPGGGLVLQW